MANYIQKGEHIDFVNSGAEVIKRGDVVVLPSRIAIADTDIAVGEMGTIALVGVYELDAGAVAINVGDAVYWDAEAGNIKVSATSNTAAGMAVTSKGGAAGKVNVRIG